MLSRTLRPNLFIKSSHLRVLKRTSPKYYTTDDSKPNFWEIPEVEAVETNNSVKSRSSRTVTDTRDFRELLDTLFDRKPSVILPKSTSHKAKETDSVIEKKLLDLVVHNRQLYKEKAPLPRSMMAPIYGKTVHKIRRNSEEDDDERTNNWDMSHIAQDERIKMKEKELHHLNQIVETTNSLDLLKSITKEMDQTEYPSYYPKLITKAIEHASQSDPYLAITIFELAKAKSVESYIFGCTTKVYDAMLLLRWETWRDVYGMLNLVEEMTVNGIEYSNDSRRIVRSVVQEIESDNDVSWDQDEKRACNLMKEMIGKWVLSK
ncbi:hypothetical protein EDC94DRAFT_66314 [Helicostylum pulchrum]|uniref:Mtf2-like C-terminal domain-containing protein n=1 Tax=Helicostylum pulchrum TaxID=562976 RepID=A0ABP9Y7Y1_9FUNG|nr:hypothetical protein EDC94DRAFT_66314 [Helicostylum pulchrum]